MIFFLYTTESKLQPNLHPCSARGRRPWCRALRSARAPRAPGEGLGHFSPSLPTCTFFLSPGDSPSMQKFRPSPLSDDTSFGSAGKWCTEGKGTGAAECSSSPPEIRQQLWLFHNTAEPKNLALDGCSRHTVCHKPLVFRSQVFSFKVQ